MDLSVPKHVTFQNPRLRHFSQCIHIVYVILLVLFTTQARYFSQSFSMGHTIQVNFEVTGTLDRARLQHEYQWTYQAGNVCANASRFDYTHYVDGILFNNHRCIHACGEQPNVPCLDIGEMYKQVSKDNVIFFTHMATISKSSRSNETSVSSYLIPYVGALGLRIEFFYDIKQTELGRLMPFSDSHLQGGSLGKVQTSLQSRDGHPRRVVPPGGPVDISIAELFQMAGNNDVLSQLTSEGDYPWVSGLDLEVTLDCRPIGEGIFPGKPVCSLAATTRPRWVTVQTSVSNMTDRIEGRSVQAVFHGIHVSSRRTGKMDVLDPERIYYNMICLIVLMFIPKWLVLQFVIHGLGQLSRIFRDQIFESFCLTSLAARMATQLMTNQLAYDWLSDQSTGISKSRIDSRVRKALVNQLGALEPQEVDAFINFTFNSLNLSDCGACPAENATIKIDSYMKCVDADKFTNLILFFDGDRIPRPWESFFVQRSLKTAAMMGKTGKTNLGESNRTSSPHASSTQDVDGDDMMAVMGFQPSSKSQERKRFRKFETLKPQPQQNDEHSERPKEWKFDESGLPSLEELDKLLDGRLKTMRAELDLRITRDMQKVLSSCAHLEEIVGQLVEESKKIESEEACAGVSRCPSRPELEENNSVTGSAQQGGLGTITFTEGMITTKITDVELLPKPCSIERLQEENDALISAKIKAAETPGERLSAAVTVLQQRLQSLEQQHQSSVHEVVALEQRLCCLEQHQRSACIGDQQLSNDAGRQLSNQVKELREGLKQVEFRVDGLSGTVIHDGGNADVEADDAADPSFGIWLLTAGGHTKGTPCTGSWSLF